MMLVDRHLMRLAGSTLGVRPAGSRPKEVQSTLGVRLADLVWTRLNGRMRNPALSPIESPQIAASARNKRSASIVAGWSRSSENRRVGIVIAPTPIFSIAR